MPRERAPFSVAISKALSAVMVGISRWNSRCITAARYICRPTSKKSE